MAARRGRGPGSGLTACAGATPSPRGLSQNRPLSHILAYNQTGKGGSCMHVVVVKSPKCLRKLLKAIFHMK